MNRFDIYDATQQWHGCADRRPWLIVELRPNGIYGCFPIASECYRESCFPLDSSHQDFAATGLMKSCHIIDSHIHDIPLKSFHRRRGQLERELLNDFREFSGI